MKPSQFQIIMSMLFLILANVVDSAFAMIFILLAFFFLGMALMNIFSGSDDR